MKKRIKTYVTNRHYDIAGQEMNRIGKHCLISKCSRYEDLSGGPGWKSALLFFVLHYLRQVPGMERVQVEKYIDNYLNR